MFFPKLNELKQKAVTISSFAGLNCGPVTQNGEFAYMENLTSQGSPVLMPRPGRSIYHTIKTKSR